jgi:hypothetical protein
MADIDNAEQLSAEQRSVRDVREIEQATERLEQTLQRAREAVERANRADSMRSPGIEDAVSEAEPARDDPETQPEGTDPSALHQDRKD